MLKFIFILTTLCCLKGVARSYGQNVTLPRTQAPMTAVLKEICRQINMDYAFSESAAPLAKNTVVVEFNGIPFTETLNKLFQHTGLTYILLGRVVLVQKGSQRPSTPILPWIPITVSGRVTDSTGLPLAGVTVQVKGGENGTVTDATGLFTLKNIEETAIIRFSYIGYIPVEASAKQIAEKSTVQLKLDLASMKDVVISYNTGYQNIPKERATGSFTFVDNDLLNRRISTNVLERMEGVTNGLSFVKNLTKQPLRNESEINIRGRSTLFANPNPLIILDNFPYNGDLTSINPNDIESITILKDAAAASIWGAFSGNGVIVITSKKGSLNEKPKINLTTNMTFIGKPDLFYEKKISPTEFIDIEQLLFDKGFFNSRPSSTSRPYLSPVVEILFKKRAGQITEDEASKLIEQYRNKDIRTDLENYVYRNALNQQYALSIQGGNKYHQYFVSGGYDRTQGNMSYNGWQRFSLTARNTYKIIPEKMELSSAILFSNSKNRTTSGAATISFGSEPYLSLIDDTGKENGIGKGLRQLYTDTAGKGLLLNWTYFPLEEMRLSENRTTTMGIRANTELKYTPANGLNIKAVYQYVQEQINVTNLYNENSYYVRNLVNAYSQINFSTGKINRIIPLGAILDSKNEILSSNNWRITADYSKKIGARFFLSSLAGWEIRSIKGESTPNLRRYGFNEDLQTDVVVDYMNAYPQYSNGAQLRIPNNSMGIRKSNSTDNYFSFFANAGLTYQQKYTWTVSGRKDNSNIFGVKSNQKGVPLWSTGILWAINKEAFYNLHWLPELKFRATVGYNGNVDKTTSAFVTATTSTFNWYGANTQYIQNPPNPELRWEKIRMINLGLDFASRTNRISGSLEYYRKKGVDIIGYSQWTPSTGISQFKGNVADITGQGVDIALHTNNLVKGLKWQSDLLFSYTTDKVLRYKAKAATASEYVGTAGALTPEEGRPIYSLYSYDFRGLDETGNPLGILDGEPSVNYGQIASAPGVGTLVYSGPTLPPFFGSLRNSLRYQSWELSFLLSFKAGYYFRREVTSSFSGIIAYPDYARRWQKSGDENTSTVPAFLYPANPSRNSFYENSDVFVEKGDHIRIQDISVAYDVGKVAQRLKFKTARLQAYVNNIGILWRANKQGIDPEFARSGSFPNPLSFSLGINANF